MVVQAWNWRKLPGLVIMLLFHTVTVWSMLSSDLSGASSGAWSNCFPASAWRLAAHLLVCRPWHIDPQTLVSTPPTTSLRWGTSHYWPWNPRAPPRAWEVSPQPAQWHWSSLLSTSTVTLKEDNDKEGDFWPALFYMMTLGSSITPLSEIL